MNYFTWCEIKFRHLSVTLCQQMFSDHFPPKLRTNQYKFDAQFILCDRHLSKIAPVMLWPSVIRSLKLQKISPKPKTHSTSQICMSKKCGRSAHQTQKVSIIVGLRPKPAGSSPQQQSRDVIQSDSSINFYLAVPVVAIYTQIHNK